jgi:hypothetical protein
VTIQNLPVVVLDRVAKPGSGWQIYWSAAGFREGFLVVVEGEV